MKKKVFLLATILVLTLCLCVGCSDKIPEKPDDTTLEFWIAEDVSSVDLSEHYARTGVFGAKEYYGKGYSPAEILEGNEDILPKRYVIYTIGGYPDTSDDWNYITRIQITDPEVTVYGITCNTSLDEFDEIMKGLGYKIHEETATMHLATLGKVSFRLISSNGEGKLSISVEVTNKKGVVY